MKTPEQRKSAKQEKLTAERWGGQVTPGSGAGWKSKGDVVTERFLIENKIKMDDNAKSFTVKLPIMRKLRQEAIQSSKYGVLQFQLGPHRYVVLEEDDLLELLDGVA